jgi:hypothetical protein
MQCMYIGISQPFFWCIFGPIPIYRFEISISEKWLLDICVYNCRGLHYYILMVVRSHYGFMYIYIYTLDCMIIHLDMQLGLDVCIVVCILFRFVFMHICIYWYHYICLLAPYCFPVFDVWSLYSPQKHRLTAVHFGGSYHRVNIQKHVENPWFPTWKIGNMICKCWVLLGFPHPMLVYRRVIPSQLGFGSAPELPLSRSYQGR